MLHLYKKFQKFVTKNDIIGTCQNSQKAHYGPQETLGVNGSL